MRQKGGRISNQGKLRSTVDLIEELKIEGQQHFTVELVVGFENTSILIDSKLDAEEAHSQLVGAMQQGGIPIGLIWVDSTIGHGKQILTPGHRIYPEHSEVEADCRKLMETIRENLRQSLFKIGAKIENKPDAA